MLTAMSVVEYPPRHLSGFPQYSCCFLPWLCLPRTRRALAWSAYTTPKTRPKVFVSWSCSSLCFVEFFGFLSGVLVGPGLHPFVKMVAYSDSRGKWFLMFLCKKISDVPLWNILVGRGRVPSLSSVFFPAFPVLFC